MPTDKTTSTFPTMGTSAALAAVSGPDPAHTTLVPKQHARSSAPDNAGTAIARPHTLERNGFKGAPQTTLYAPNAAEAMATGRNVYLMPPSRGNQSFYDKRQYGQVTQ